ncbi:Epimerase family protein [Nymphon striatum]|nr:Epimerase family protein [Nymphon striatum]
MKSSTGVYVLEQGTEAMMSRAWLSDQAEHTIDVQYFIFSADNIGLIATDYLVKAAERGIKVRILVDDLMVDANGDELLKLAAHKNLSIRIYNPMANIGKNIAQKLFYLSKDFHGFNQRMHNKTFTVDNKVSITGGRNVADEYFGYDHEYNFRDRDVLLLGGIVNNIQSSFNQFWDDSLSVDIEKLVKTNDIFTNSYNDLHQYACNPANFVPKVRDRINNLSATFDEIQQAGKLYWVDGVEYVSDIPGKNDGSKHLGGSGISTQRLISLVKHAKKSVIIQTALSSNDRFNLASNDNLEAFSGYQRDRKKLLNTGVEIYEFKPDAKIRQKVMSEDMLGQLKRMPIFGLHSKSMVIDDEITVIGTFNLDPRSANLNTESIAIIPSREVTKDVKLGMLEEIKPENAWRTTTEWNPDGEVDKVKQLRIKAHVMYQQRYLITGGSGFIGSELIKKLLLENHDVTVLTRNEVKTAQHFADIMDLEREDFQTKAKIKTISSLDAINPDQSFDVIVNLAGQGIADTRWSDQVFISGSALGYYGIRETEDEINELGETDNSFSSQLCQQWEKEAQAIEALGIRTCYLRTGIVLGKGGGALVKMLPPFKMGLGGPIGNGKQWMSWIHMEDIVGMIRFAIDHEDLTGAINGTAPNPVTNKEFSKTLGKVLKRPAFFPMPSFVVKLLFGQMGEELLLSGQRVVPEKMISEGYQFQYASLENALRDIV